MSDLNFKDSGSEKLKDLQVLFRERKERLLKKIHEENCAKKTLYEKLTALEKPDDYDNVEMETGQILTNVKKLSADAEELIREEESKSEEVMLASRELENLEKRRDELLLETAGPSDHDKQLLKQCREKVKIYEKLTGVTWIRSPPNINGYIGNRHNNYIKLLTQDSTDNLWEEIGKAASADWSEFLPQTEDKCI